MISGVLNSCRNGYLEYLVLIWVGGAMAPSVFEEVIGCSGILILQSYLTELFPGLKSKFRMDVTPPSPSRYMVIGDNADLFQEL